MLYSICLLIYGRHREYTESDKFIDDKKNQWNASLGACRFGNVYVNSNSPQLKYAHTHKKTPPNQDHQKMQYGSDTQASSRKHPKAAVEQQQVQILFFTEKI